MNDVSHPTVEFLNFRDLNGVKAEDGRRLTAGKLARSAAFDGLSAEGAARLTALGMGYTADFRTHSEQARHPSALVSHGLMPLFAPPHSDPAAVMQLLADPTVTVEDVRAEMIRVYAAAPEEFATPFRALFEGMMAAKSGVVIHCAIGKDRTGMAVALVLAALGVPRAVILEDYLATNAAGAQILATLAARFPGRSRIPSALFAPLLAAEPDYLAAFWAELDSRYGGEMGYLTTELGLDARDLAAWRDRWLA